MIATPKPTYSDRLEAAYRFVSWVTSLDHHPTIREVLGHIAGATEMETERILERLEGAGRIRRTDESIIVYREPVIRKAN
jgi:hypothetical protein